MAIVKQYIKKDGSKAYMFQTYIGTDPFTGKRLKTTRRGFKTKKEANLALSKLQLDVAHSGASQQNNYLFSDVFQMWYKQYSKTVKPSTLTSLESKYKKRLEPKYGKLKIKKITTVYCQKITNEWADELKSFKAYTIILNQVFKYAYRLGIITKNPFTNVIMPSNKNLTYAQQENVFENYLNRDQLKAFFLAVNEECDIKAQTMFHLLAYTGARKGEIHALHWNDIDLRNKILRLDKTLGRRDGDFIVLPSKTKQSVREISLDNKTIKVLKAWKKFQKEHYFKIRIPIKVDTEQIVFPTIISGKQEYLRLAYLNDIQRQLTKKYNLKKINVHGLRHTHASILFEAGASVKEVQTRLGHTDIHTTMNIYTHVTDSIKEKTADTFEKFMDLS